MRPSWEEIERLFASSHPMDNVLGAFAIWVRGLVFGVLAGAIVLGLIVGVSVLIWGWS